jgi:membrane-bound metal-dependent hydrolase YbcI (DUF457 family)
MDNKEHLFIGFSCGILLVLISNYFFNLFDLKDAYNILLMICITYVYSLLADIDTRASRIVWTFLGFGIVGIIVGYFTDFQILLFASIGLLTVTFIIAQFLPHRGFTHSIVFGLLVSLPWIYYAPEMALLAFLVYYSHLAADEEYLKFI